MEIEVKKIFGHILRVLRLLRTAVVIVFNGGLDASCPEDAENVFVIHIDMFVVPKVIVDPSVALIRVLHVDLLDLLGNLLVFHSPGALFPGGPTKVSGT